MEDFLIVILQLIKSAISDEKVKVNTNTDWKKIYDFSNRQQILPLVFAGITNSKINFEGSEDFFNASVQHLFLDRKQVGFSKRLEEQFNKNKIQYMLLKGVVAKNLYPKSEMRTMSDIDILILPEQYSEIEKVMQQLGCEYKYESDHELVWSKNNLVSIELHKCLVPTYNKDYYPYFGDGWRLAKPKKDAEYGKVMSNEDFFIYNFVHFAKHYRDGGIGLRHFVDIWVISNAYANMDLVYVESELEKINLLEFYKNVRRAIKVCFEGAEMDDISNKIIQWIISGGPYGTRERKKTAVVTMETAASGSVEKARLKKIFSHVFLPFYAMKDKYPVLKKSPFLLPIMWVVRWVDILLFKREKIKTESKKLKEISGSQVDEYSIELDSVGLRF